MYAQFWPQKDKASFLRQLFLIIFVYDSAVLWFPYCSLHLNNIILPPPQKKYCGAEERGYSTL